MEYKYVSTNEFGDEKEVLITFDEILELNFEEWFENNSDNLSKFECDNLYQLQILCVRDWVEKNFAWRYIKI